MKIQTLKKQWRQRLINLVPGQLVIQITDKCNAQCPQCGMRVSSKFKRSTLKKKDVFEIIKAASDQKIKALSFTGGEPLLFLDDLCDYIAYAGKHEIPMIRTGTNGYFFKGSHKPGFKEKISAIARKLSKTPIRNFWISLDSYQADVHEQMRGFDGIVKGIEKALPVFEAHGIFPSVNLGINRNLGGPFTRRLNPLDFSNQSEFQQTVYLTYKKAFSFFYERVIDLGFTIANACYPMSIQNDNKDLSAVYAASAVDDIVKFSALEKQMIFKALKDTIPIYRGRIRIFSPQVSLNALIKEYKGEIGYSQPCHGGLNYFFVDSKNGDTFPCGYRGRQNFGKFQHLNIRGLKEVKECRECDWECFRDPSELLGPLLDLASSPISLTKRVISDPSHMKLWFKDLRYYRSCGYFNGRKSPDYKKMELFSTI